MRKVYKCPVCGKTLTEAEYDKALGLWEEKQEHIKHLEDEQKRLREQEKRNQKILAKERKKLKEKELTYQRTIQKQAKDFRKQQITQKREFNRIIAQQERKSAQQMKNQKKLIEKSFEQKMAVEIKKGITVGIQEQKRALKKQEIELRKSKNKMASLENSLKVSAKKYELAMEEIKKLREQIDKGITPQIEGLLEEGKLLAKLKELFPQDKFEHIGKGGDIIHIIIEQAKEIGKIVYECKKVKLFNKNHIEQAKEARTLRKADFAVLVTNAFPSKKQYYFVEKNVFVISPVSLEPIVYMLRESLVKIALLKMTNAAKEKAVQEVYNFLSSNEYNNKINDIAGQLVDLGKDLQSEIAGHKRTWLKRYHIYRHLFNDVGLIDNRLRELVHEGFSKKVKMLPAPKKEFVEIEELT